MKCDIKIMAVPSRLGNVAQLCSQLGLTIEDCAIDYEYSHLPLKTSREAFSLPYAEGVTHRLVLQDDVKICDNLQAFCDMLVNRYPESIIALCERDNSKKKKEIPHNCVHTTKFVTGQGLIIPRKYLNSIFNYLDRNNPSYPHDDWYYSYWAKIHKIEILSVFPSVVDSYRLKDVPSEMGHKGMFEVRAGLFDAEDPMLKEWNDRRDIVTKSSLLSLLKESYFLKNKN